MTIKRIGTEIALLALIVLHPPVVSAEAPIRSKAMAGSSVFEVGPPSLSARSSTTQSLAATSSEASPVITTLGLYRYPPEKPFEETDREEAIHMVDGRRLALVTDDAVAFWFRVDFPEEFVWTEEGTPPLHIQFRDRNGTAVGFSTDWRFLKIVDATGTYYCMEARQSVFGGTVWCAGHPPLWWGGGTAWTPAETRPFGYYSADMTFEDTAFADESYFLTKVLSLDPNPAPRATSLIQSTGEITNDMLQLSQADLEAYKTEYAATDGVTPLVLVAGTTPDIPVTFRIVGGSEDGSLVSLDRTQGPADAVSPETAEGVHDQTYSAAIYTTPEQFSFEPTTNVERPIQLEVEFGTEGVPTLYHVDLKLMRPPVLFIHGIWSDGSAWDELKKSAGFDGLGKIKALNAFTWGKLGKFGGQTRVRGNLTHVKRGVDDLRETLHKQRVAATQVDVVTHSAGGQLARLWVQTAEFRRPENLKQGDFRRLATIGTPHLGSQMPQFVQELRDALPFDGARAINAIASATGHSLVAGAFQDQDPGSSMLRSLRATSVPSRAYYGTASTLPIPTHEWVLWNLLAKYCGVIFAKSVQQCQGINEITDAEVLRSKVFKAAENDGIVRKASQMGGLTGSGSTFELNGTIHTKETRSNMLGGDLPLQLSSEGGFSMMGFPAPQLTTQ